MYPGRVILCLGAGAPADLKAAGIESPQAAHDTHRGDRVCARAVCRRDGRVPGSEICRSPAGGSSMAARKVPIVLAASRPNMLKLAGRASRRRADLGRDVAALRAGLPRAGRDRRGRPAVPQARASSTRKLGATRESRIDPHPPPDRLRAARRRIMPRTSACPARTLDQAALRHAYAAEDWARSRPPGERRRGAPPRGLRHAGAGARQARGISRDRSRRGHSRRRSMMRHRIAAALAAARG